MFVVKVFCVPRQGVPRTFVLYPFHPICCYILQDRKKRNKRNFVRVTLCGMVAVIGCRPTWYPGTVFLARNCFKDEGRRKVFGAGVCLCLCAVWCVLCTSTAVYYVLVCLCACVLRVCVCFIISTRRHPAQPVSVSILQSYVRDASAVVTKLPATPQRYNNSTSKYTILCTKK